ncbi:response regulator transcription factor [Chryseolinea sp. H1M3-3]|uniref:response regulator n=1 Tax=Chryseolinea sp. H1M3-3 TaxID=3034144 RepID=UPI0023EBC599|nr:response regulator transcription factor [Chryseolinea sp. H1M3-3]
MSAVGQLKLALVDDHQLFRKGLISLIQMVCPSCEIVFEANNGSELPQKLKQNNAPDIIVVDVNMPTMDGFATVQWIRENFPEVKVLIVSMIDKEETIVRMLKLGVKGYLCKDVEPKELGEALMAISNKGFYYTDFITGKLVHSLQSNSSDKTKVKGIDQINEQERKFLQFACSEMTYYEIADKMFLSPKTIDGYRNSLFEKLEVKSRVGLALFAVKHGLVPL